MKNLIFSFPFIRLALCWGLYLNVVVLANLSLASDNHEPPKFCDSKSNGNYKNPSNCKSYYQCINGDILLRSCGSNLEFNDRYQRCTSRETANCTEDVPSTTVSTTTEDTTEGTENTRSFSTTTESPERPPNFPSSITLTRKKFENWAQEISVSHVWEANPSSTDDILTMVNWAWKESYEIRASGFVHTWAPISTFNANERFSPTSEQPRVILAKTANLNKMEITKRTNLVGATGEFWAEPGIEMEKLLQKLQNNNMGLLNHPAVGKITLGGALAIGGHGAAVAARGEIKSTGHTYGSLSNLIVSLDAIVFDRVMNAYVVKRFHRSDMETKAFLVHLGRSFITNVTMRAGPLHYLRCISDVETEMSELFADPDEAALNASIQTFSNLLDEYGRVETISFPFQSRPWLKVWKVSPKKPKVSRKVNQPYNYGFSDGLPKEIGNLVKKIIVQNQTHLARSLGFAMYNIAKGGLETYNAKDLWGASPNVFLYIKPTTLRTHICGYAVITSRNNVQKVLYEIYKFFNDTVHAYERDGKFPINGPLEIRVSGVDNPRDVDVLGASSPTISATRPVEGKPDFDTFVWFNAIYVPGTPYSEEFMAECERHYFSIFDGEYATIRVEWSKGWAYSSNTTWKNKFLLEDRRIQKGFEDWDFTAKTLNEYDPYKVFSNPFHTYLFNTTL